MVHARLAFVLAALLAVALACPPNTSGREPDGDIVPPPPPPAVCDDPLTPRDTTGAVVVTDCTEAGLDQALADVTAAGGGAITFACEGSATILLTTEKRVTVDLVVDGTNTGAAGGTVTLDGQEATRIFFVASSFDLTTPTLTLQRLTLTRGRASGTDLLGGGGAVYREGGSLEVIECFFTNNHGNVDGQDTAGGAINSFGTGTTTIVSSTFTDNACSNGGALGNLGNTLHVVNSAFDNNRATGTGGNPGNGGNGGTISVDGADHETALCGVRITDSTANAFGGAFFRVAYNGTDPTTFDRVWIEGAHIDDRDPSMGGAIYAQGTVTTLRRSSIVGNEARNAGGVFFGPDATVHVENTSFLDNTALSGLGGGVVLNAVAGGEIVNATFAGNAAPGEVAFGGAISGDAGSNVAMRNTLVIGNVAGNGFNPISCTTKLGDGAASFQFPVVRAGGGTDDPDALCADDIKAQDVPLDAIARDEERGVVTRAPGAPAISAGVDCPAVDALGNARPAQGCTSGAVEVP